MVVYLIKPSTEFKGRCRFARHPVAMAYSGKADVMMSHYWDGSWGDLIACAAQGSTMGRYIWICALANRYLLSSCILTHRAKSFSRRSSGAGVFLSLS